MKKILAFFCAVAAACFFSACGNNRQNSSSTASNPHPTTSEPQPSSSAAASTSGSSEVHDKIETLPDGAILKVNEYSVSLSSKRNNGSCLGTYVFDGDKISSYSIKWTDLVSSEAQKNLKLELESLGFVLAHISETSMTHVADDAILKKLNEQYKSKADLIQQLKDVSKSQVQPNSN